MLSFLLAQAPVPYTWTATEVGALAVTVGGIIGGLLTFVATKGVEAWIKIKEDARKDVIVRAEAAEIAEREDEMHEATKELINVLKSRMDAYEVEIKSLRNEHLDCAKVQARLEGRLEAAMDELQSLRAQMMMAMPPLPPVKVELSHIPAPETIPDPAP